jgi:hypothetical protein
MYKYAQINNPVHPTKELKRKHLIHKYNNEKKRKQSFDLFGVHITNVIGMLFFCMRKTIESLKPSYNWEERRQSEKMGYTRSTYMNIEKPLEVFFSYQKKKKKEENKTIQKKPRNLVDGRVDIRI